MAFGDELAASGCGVFAAGEGGERSLLQTGGWRPRSSLDSNAVTCVRFVRPLSSAGQVMSSGGMAHILGWHPHCAGEDGPSGVDSGCVLEQATRLFPFSLSRTAPWSWRRFGNVISAKTVRDTTIAHSSFGGGAL